MKRAVRGPARGGEERAAVTRRGFLGGALAAGGALSLGVSFGGLGCGGAESIVRRADRTGDLVPNMYVTVTRAGRVQLTVGKCEMGQGVTTGQATLVAEELAVGVDQVDIAFADSLPEFRVSGAEGVPMFRIHLTGGSTSTAEAWLPLRRAGASAREMLIAAAARAWRVPRESCAAEDGHVVHRPTGRRRAYGALTRLAAREAVPEDPPLVRREHFRLIGKHSRRVDARAKVTGQARFGIDVDVPGAARAVVIHGPVYGAEPVSIRAEAARAMPGVVDVFPFRWGVAVVAERTWQAQRAARAVEVTWGEGLVAGLDTAELAAAARAHREPGLPVRADGDVDDALARADVRRVEAVYEVPYLAHAPMEPQNCTVAVRDGSAEVWAPTQGPTIIQEAVADAVGLDPDDVLVHTTLCGGGFGRRALGDVAAQAAVIAQRVRRPVQLLWSRESDTRQGFYRPAATAFARGAVDRRGRAVALSLHTLSQPISSFQLETMRGGQPAWLPRLPRRTMANSTAALMASNTVADLFASEGASDTPYRIPDLRVEYTPIRTRLPVGFWRSVGHSFNAFFVESLLDELAAAADRDPVELRRELLPAGSRERRVLDAVAELAWGRPAAPGFGRGVARHTSFGSEAAHVVEAGVVDGRIRVTRVWAAIECGQVVNPDIVVSQIESAIVFGIGAAVDQEITLVGGKVQQGNFDGFRPLRMHECPEIVVRVLERSDPPTGVGEPGLPPVAPAIAGALFAATGVRLRRLPLQRAWDDADGGRR